MIVRFFGKLAAFGFRDPQGRSARRYASWSIRVP